MSGSGAGTNGPAARRKRQPLKATPERLERSALYYLERYDSSSGHLRRHLRRKVALSARVHGTDAEEGRAEGDRVIARLTGLGPLEHTREDSERGPPLLAPRQPAVTRTTHRHRGGEATVRTGKYT